MTIEAQAEGTRCAHAHHVGSLLRPQKLLQKRIAFHAGQCTAEELKALEDEVLPGLLKLQKDVGLAITTDGEIRRYDFTETGDTARRLISILALFRDVYTQGIFEGLDGMTFGNRERGMLSSEMRC